MLIRDMTIMNDKFWPMLLGVIFQASATPFFINSQSYVVNRWFSDKERALATGLFSAAMVMGNGISYGLTGYMFEGAKTSE